MSLLMIGCAVSQSESLEGRSYISYKQPFPLIDDVNRQAEAWATCAAVYRIMSNLSDSPAESTQYNNTGNGAEVAVLMTFMYSVISEDNPEPSKFYSTWEYAKTLMEAMPEAQSATIMADSKYQETDKWVANLSATLLQCAGNVEFQQAYIDAYRAMLISGLFEFKE